MRGSLPSFPLSFPSLLPSSPPLTTTSVPRTTALAACSPSCARTPSAARSAHRPARAVWSAAARRRNGGDGGGRVRWRLDYSYLFNGTLACRVRASQSTQRHRLLQEYVKIKYLLLKLFLYLRYFLQWCTAATTSPLLLLLLLPSLLLPLQYEYYFCYYSYSSYHYSYCYHYYYYYNYCHLSFFFLFFVFCFTKERFKR